MKYRKDIPRPDVLYVRHQPTIFGVCQSLWKKYGGELEEYVSEAHLHFMTVYWTHDPARQSFEADVQFRVRGKLMETIEKESNRKRILNAVAATEENVRAAVAGAYFDLGEFMDQLTKRAQEVVRIALNPPPDVELGACERRGRDDPTSIRMAIREYLKDMRWTAGAVASSFTQIQKALQGE